MSKETGGSAFPTTEKNYWNENVRDEGMTLRDYFAAKAMEGAFASGVTINIGVKHQGEMDNMALSFYSMADAMLKARSAE